MKHLVACLMSFGLVTFANANAEAACGTFEVAKGDVKVQSGAKVTAAAAGSKICSGDTVIAAADSRAKIRMEDGNELNISPDSKIVLENYQYDVASNKKKVLLNVLKGKVRAATREENMYNDKAKDGQANTFQVKTKSAVAGVRGTDFLTSYDPKTSKTQVTTFKGKVDVGMPGPGGTIVNAVSVGVGQTTTVFGSGAAPAVPKDLPQSEQTKQDSESREPASVTPAAPMPAPETSAAPVPAGTPGPAVGSGSMVNREDTPAAPAAPRGPASNDVKPPVLVVHPPVAPTPPPMPPQVNILQKATLKVNVRY